jgi:hypothetical protein
MIGREQVSSMIPEETFTLSNGDNSEAGAWYLDDR